MKQSGREIRVFFGRKTRSIMRSIHAFLILAASGLVLFFTRVSHAQYETFYSTADSILYVLYPSDSSAYHRFYRFRDGGARIEKTVQDISGRIIAMDNIPGHLFAFWFGPYPTGWAVILFLKSNPPLLVILLYS
jgi:hypothetical protein